jgi:hypothetical protein
MGKAAMYPVPDEHVDRARDRLYKRLKRTPRYQRLSIFFARGVRPWTIARLNEIIDVVDVPKATMQRLIKHIEK